jgi:DNA-binding transcriptional regulator YiaG
MRLSQCEFATQLGVAEQTYRTWDSGRRIPPRSIVHKAKRLQETDGGKLVPMQVLAAEYGVHVRTLRKAAQDGRLEATFSTRMAFGKLVAFASRDAVEIFKRRYYRQTTQWNRPPRLAVCVVPDDYDRVLVDLRARLRLTQTALAERVGAANKAVVYQWESRRRREAFTSALEPRAGTPPCEYGVTSLGYQIRPIGAGSGAHKSSIAERNSRVSAGPVILHMEIYFLI